MKPLEKYEDERGFFVKFHGEKSFGQFFMITIKPNKIRGGHYHKKKHEIFYVVKGKARLYLEHVETKELKIIDLDASKEILPVKIEPFHSHAIKNIGSDDAYMVAYVSEMIKDPDDDEFRYQISAIK